MLVIVLAGCGKHYWESPGRGVTEFSLDSTDCIKEATGKYGVVSEGIYRACMKARGWVRVRTDRNTPGRGCVPISAAARSSGWLRATPLQG